LLDIQLPGLDGFAVADFLATRVPAPPPLPDFSRNVSWAGVVLWPVGTVLGLASERVRYGWDSFSSWIPDLVVGLVFIGCRVHARSRNTGTSVLLSAIGLTWFLANFWSDALFIHRGLLVHVLVTYPGWRVRSRLDLAAVTGGYAAAVVLPVWRGENTDRRLCVLFNG
jgi:hypothetical protein